MLKEANQVSSHAIGPYQKLKQYLHSFYQNVTRRPAFNYLIILLFLFRFFTQFLYILILIFFWGMGWEKILSAQLVQELSDALTQLSFIDVAELTSVLVSGIFTLLGIWFLPKSRIKAYQMFEKSILISIFFTQVFVFYREEFGALVGLTINLIIFSGLQFMIRRETNPASNA